MMHNPLLGRAGRALPKRNQQRIPFENVSESGPLKREGHTFDTIALPATDAKFDLIDVDPG